MPCFFCIAVVTAIAGTIGTAAIDRLEERLTDLAGAPPRRTADSESVAKLELEVTEAGRQVPVALTVYKPQKRVRLQVLSHAVPRPVAETAVRRLARQLGLHVVAVSDPGDEALVHQAVEHLAAPQSTPPTPPVQRQPGWPGAR